MTQLQKNQIQAEFIHNHRLYRMPVTIEVDCTGARPPNKVFAKVGGETVELVYDKYDVANDRCLYKVIGEKGD